MMDDNLWLLCDCYHHALVVSGELVEFNAVAMSFWRWGNWEGGWRNRLRHIWHILKYGHPYADEIVLKHYDARQLARYLLALCPEGE